MYGSGPGCVSQSASLLLVPSFANIAAYIPVAFLPQSFEVPSSALSLCMSTVRLRPQGRYVLREGHENSKKEVRDSPFNAGNFFVF